MSFFNLGAWGVFIHLHARTLPPPLPCLRLRLGGRNRTRGRYPRAYGGRQNGRRQRRIRQYIHDVCRRDDADCIGDFGIGRRNERQDAGGNQLLNNRIRYPKSAKGRLKTELAPKSWTLIKAYSGTLCKLGSVCDRTQLFQFQTATLPIVVIHIVIYLCRKSSRCLHFFLRRTAFVFCLNDS